MDLQTIAKEIALEIKDDLKGKYPDAATIEYYCQPYKDIPDFHNLGMLVHHEYMQCK